MGTYIHTKRKEEELSSTLATVRKVAPTKGRAPSCLLPKPSALLLSKQWEGKRANPQNRAMEIGSQTTLEVAFKYNSSYSAKTCTHTEIPLPPLGNFSASLSKNID